MQGIQTALPVGSVIHNRYRIKKLLGKGGFGAVYLVQDQRVKGNLFALKEVIDPDEEERERFAFESSVLKRLDHPALLRVYREFADAKSRRSYMLMDFVDGPNLEKVRLQQPEERFPLADALQLMAPIFAAVAYLHRQQPAILHRDIKPANIIVPKNSQETVLVDLGIAKEYERDETTSAIRHCTPGYAAPEQYAHETSPRTDLYGLAATLYVLLTGVVPVDALSRLTQLNDRGRDPLEPLHELAPAVPMQIVDAIMRALALDSHERFHTVDAFWQALQTALPADLMILPPLLSPALPRSDEKAQATETPPPSPSEAEPQSVEAPVDQIEEERQATEMSLSSQSMEESPAAETREPSPPEEEQQATETREPSQSEEEPQAAETSSSSQAEEEPQFVGTSLSSQPEPQSEEVLIPQKAATARVTTLVYPVHAFHDRMTTARSSHNGRSAIWLLPLAILVLFALAGSIAFGTGFFSHMQSRSTPGKPAARPQVQRTLLPPVTPTSAPTASPLPLYPQLQARYQGHISDQFTAPPTNSTMGLSHIQQQAHGAQITGTFTVGAGLIGSGNFTGSVTQEGQVQFLVESSNGLLPLLFRGSIRSDDSIQGNYCSARQVAGTYQCDTAAGGYGTWLVS
ncbi:MAG TPA: protein kinase [Ktedonobacteraceae bacterium]|nr:protein kinase [Ktedonobacteraceae bacterium]